eukprot:CAMPEP_0115521362 /NCGR_PEP_ID=MMETSP0271-20121206/79503_1 /TAXON_ID=71861 /ORGANISM="Scrippsiella trochoidea, Strain CCMP3099" /LENGTH=94 /DNA_ID=CAMNT_0002952583 /DNA_START=840 /DNA_END=1124 /DNA_ORIENTATION=-
MATQDDDGKELEQRQECIAEAEVQVVPAHQLLQASEPQQPHKPQQAQDVQLVQVTQQALRTPRLGHDAICIKRHDAQAIKPKPPPEVVQDDAPR